MVSTDGVVGIAEYAEWPLHDVGGGVSAAHVSTHIEAPLPPEVVAVLLGIAVMSAVELVE